MNHRLTAPSAIIFFLVIFGLASGVFGGATAQDEWKVMRQDVFEFTEKPSIVRDGSAFVVRFASRGYCDATVAIEQAGAGDGPARIVRHLASGCLGPNAPAPLQPNSLTQVIPWDGKNDAGVLIDKLADLNVRVSLGLKPQFERTMFWQPMRRPGVATPLMAATTEGVYVFQGGSSIDSLILYDHDGNYVRTVYPFPSDKIDKVNGLLWHTYQQDGLKLPLKTNYLQDTMLTSGTNATGVAMLDPETGQPVRDESGRVKDIISFSTAHFGMHGSAATTMAIRGQRIALANRYVNRFATDGTSGGMELRGPSVYLSAEKENEIELGQGSPLSSALSPDGKTLYLTGYIYARIQRASQDIAKLSDPRSIPVVMKVDMDARGGQASAFAGQTAILKAGSDPAGLKVPSCVAADDAGRVYIGDYINDRIQVLDPAGKLLKSIPAYRPARIVIHPKTGELYVFSWWVRNQYEDEAVRRVLTHYGSFDNPKKLHEWEYAAQGRFSVYWGATIPIEFTADIDFNCQPAKIWMAEPWTGANVLNMGKIAHTGIAIFKLTDSGVEKIRDFASEVAGQRLPVPTADYHRQRLYVNHADGKLYLSEGDDSAVGKSFCKVFEIDPETGKWRVIDLPFDAEDMCFGHDGVVYLRTIDMVGRYDPKTWREIPWDYGEERDRVAYGWMSITKFGKLTSGLAMPAEANWHQGGMFVTPMGHLAVACGLNISLNVRTAAKYVHTGKKYEPRVYPGRLMAGRGGMTCLHVWDRHGKMIHEDAVQGLADLYGLGIDRDDNFYMMSAAPRVVDGKPYHNIYAGTIMKFAVGGRVLTAGDKGVPVDISETELPQRPADLSGGMQGKAWTDAKWFYGGVGFGGKNTNGCACHNARMTFDFFNRTWAPELERYKVAVLDSNGNLILRIGKYGNIDDGKPIVSNPAAPPPRPVGGDEVALFHGAYLATHTDHRLFIADPGNGRVLSVKLDYHATERCPVSSHKLSALSACALEVADVRLEPRPVIDQLGKLVQILSHLLVTDPHAVFVTNRMCGQIGVGRRRRAGIDHSMSDGQFSEVLGQQPAFTTTGLSTERYHGPTATSPRTMIGRPAVAALEDARLRRSGIQSAGMFASAWNVISTRTMRWFSTSAM